MRKTVGKSFGSKSLDMNPGALDGVRVAKCVLGVNKHPITEDVDVRNISIGEGRTMTGDCCVCIWDIACH